MCACVCARVCVSVVVCLCVSMCVCVVVPSCVCVFGFVSGVPIEYLRVDVFIYFNGL